MTARRSRLPGRAGRLRLRRRLAAAERGADLLERKMRLLLDRRRAQEDTARTAEARWRELIAAAEDWLVKGVVIAGEGSVAQAAPGTPGTLDVSWDVLMGVRHPSGSAWTPPARDPGAAAARSTALVHAEAAYRDAVEAGARYAVALAAAALLSAEADRTRQRVRALRRHWIPRLTAELAAADQALEQTEHEESVRRRWAASHTPPRLHP
ncbi:V-type ATP synthase subunit D [Streptomyces tropicalis]|uniref:V-type ATP synthase subunit D n=1 Tax=Streptomyces tropicalis TaxID=3034234 RepID=A0ABT6AA17_9ACTN|nr:V-type ATP synthase subunit D [Streptomyces tropicalis]MDF3301496.1 V-type ATP synthase subunit D [Streptomyces tropicalis]